MVYISRIRGDFGDWELQASERGLVRAAPGTSFVHGRENEISRQAAEELLLYFRGEPVTFTVPLDPRGTDFQRTVWDALCEIPWGDTRSYSAVAARIGRPEAVRAVAGAIGKNPCLIFIPCHRVLGKNGSLTGFSAGLELKQSLLKLEQSKSKEKEVQK